MSSDGSVDGDVVSLGICEQPYCCTTLLHYYTTPLHYPCTAL